MKYPRVRHSKKLTIEFTNFRYVVTTCTKVHPECLLFTFRDRFIENAIKLGSYNWQTSAVLLNRFVCVKMSAERYRGAKKIFPKPISGGM